MSDAGVHLSIAKESGMFLPFLVGSTQLAVHASEVARIVLPQGIATLSNYQGIPNCVVGVCASESEMLTIVDAGVLWGKTPIAVNMKTRLIVMQGGALRGFALLVSRVLDLSDLSQIKECTLIKQEQILVAIKESEKK
jgi:chemotaxis signal transduction protein